MGQFSLVSSGLRIRSPAILVWFFVVQLNSVKVAILMFDRLLCAVSHEGATMIFAVPTNWGSDCTAHVMSLVLLVMTIADTVVVCCGGIVSFPSAHVWTRFGLQVLISSVIAIVMTTCGKLFVLLHCLCLARLGGFS